MKKMQELIKYTDLEIESKIFELKQEIFNLRFKQATGQLTDTARVKKARKQIARLYTILTERKSTKE